MTTSLLAIINGKPTKIGTYGLNLIASGAVFADQCARFGIHARDNERKVGSTEITFKLPMSKKLGELLVALSNVELPEGWEVPNVFVLRDDGIQEGTYKKADICL